MHTVPQSALSVPAAQCSGTSHTLSPSYEQVRAG